MDGKHHWDFDLICPIFWLLDPCEHRKWPHRLGPITSSSHVSTNSESTKSELFHQICRLFRSVLQGLPLQSYKSKLALTDRNTYATYISFIEIRVNPITLTFQPNTNAKSLHDFCNAYFTIHTSYLIADESLMHILNMQPMSNRNVGFAFS